jgi:HNH endonuclease
MDVFVYDKDIGLLSRRKPRKNRVAVGCCNLSTSGHYQTYIDGRLYASHRIIWAMMTGEWPPSNMEIDHINLVKTDNSWNNLRLATKGQNTANTKSRRDGRLKGAYQSGVGYTSGITVGKVWIYLGYFGTELEAHAAYVEAAIKFHGKFARAA